MEEKHIQRSKYVFEILKPDFRYAPLKFKPLILLGKFQIYFLGYIYFSGKKTLKVFIHKLISGWR